jgi:glycosyltransferase involved in cell wall biosynthesis
VPTTPQRHLAERIESALRTRTPGDVLVSVIMAAYNGERYIAESIQSALDQTFAGLEVIVIDDGSTDGTAAVVKAMAAKDPRVVYLHQANGRQGKARNNGIRNARGDVIAFLDQDDLWVPHKLEVQLAAMAERYADVVFSDGFLFREDAIHEQWRTFETIVGRFESRDFFRLNWIENRIPILSAIIRKRAITDAGMITEELGRQGADDMDLWLKLAARGAVFLGMPELLVRYRVHGAQDSRDLAKMLKAEIHVLEEYRHTRLVELDLRDRRFAIVYRRLILELLEKKDLAQAAQWLNTWADRAGESWPRMLAKTLTAPGGVQATKLAMSRFAKPLL